MYISLLIIPCIIYYVTNKETLTLIDQDGESPNESRTLIKRRKKREGFVAQVFPGRRKTKSLENGAN